MKIINRSEFLKLPAGTLYSEFKLCVFDGLFVKGKTVGGDYYEESLIGNVAADSSEQFNDILFAAVAGAYLQLEFYSIARNGMLNQGQLYAVYGLDEIKQLIMRLTECVSSRERNEI